MGRTEGVGRLGERVRGRIGGRRNECPRGGVDGVSSLQICTNALVSIIRQELVKLWMG